MTYWADDRRLDLEQRRLDAAQQRAKAAMTAKLSPTMTDALDRLRATGALVKSSGGFWTVEAAVEVRPGVPDWWVGTQTVDGLVQRGLARRISWRRVEVVEV